MNLSTKTLERLGDIITGNSNESPYRSGRQLIDFFHDFGERDLYGQGFPPRETYTFDKLKKFNGSEKIKGIICNTFDFWDAPNYNPEATAFNFNKKLTRDGFQLVIEYYPGWMQGDKYIQGEPYFDVRPVLTSVIPPKSLAATSHEAIVEQVMKANTKIESGDFAGAIANAYTLLEELLKLLLLETGTSFKENEGDIRNLYKILRERLHLDPSKPGIDVHLKPILDGFQKIVAGLYEVANKASDRHARKYTPSGHHAKLAVNSAFALCEFLVESRRYQENQSHK